MITKIFDSKFSIMDDRYDMISKLDKFVWYLAWRNGDETHPMMSPDDVAMELKMEVMKGLQVYPYLPEEQLMAVLKRMLDNRIAELIHRYYGTHRKVEATVISLDAQITALDSYSDIEYSKDVPTPEDLYASIERVEATRSRLQPEEQQVLDYVLSATHNELDTVLRTSMLAAEQRFSSPHVEIKPKHVAEAMGLPEDFIKKTFRAISQAYMEALNE